LTKADTLLGVLLLCMLDNKQNLFEQILFMLRKTNLCEIVAALTLPNEDVKRSAQLTCHGPQTNALLRQCHSCAELKTQIKLLLLLALQ